MKRKPSNLFLLAAATLVAASSAHAATWSTDIAGNWSDTTKWSGGTIADGTDAIADFSTLNLAAARIVTVDTTSRTVGTLQFGDTGATGDVGWTIASSGSPLATLALATGSGQPTISTGTTGTSTGGFLDQVGHTINVGLTGTQGFNITGTNSVTFGAGALAAISGTATVTGGRMATNSLGGLTTVDVKAGGQLALSTSGTNNLTYSQNISIAGAGTTGSSAPLALWVGSGNLSATLSGTITLTGNASIGSRSNSTGTYNGVISDGGNGYGLTFGNIGNGSTFIMEGTSVLTQLNTYSGKTTIANGVVSINTIKDVNGGTSSLGDVTTVANGTIDIGAGAAGGTVVATLRYTGVAQDTNRVINLAGTTAGASLDQSAASGLLKFTSDFTATGLGNKTLTLTGSTAGTGEIAGAIVNSTGFATAVTKTGTGTWTLSGSNTYSGGSNIKNGSLVLAGGDDRLLTTGFVALGDTATAGKLVLGDTTAASNQTLAGLTATSFTGSSVVGAHATNNSILTLNIASGTNTFAGVLGGAGTNENKLALVKSGSGTLALSGVNTYSGGSTVSAGTLSVGHVNALGSGGVTVAGGTLDINSRAVTNAIRLDSGTVNVTTGSFGTLSNTLVGIGTGTLNSGTNSATTFTVAAAGLKLANLTGQGTFTGGLVTVTGQHNPGNSPGTQTFESGLTYAGDTVVNLEIAGNGLTWDRVVVSNTQNNSTLTIGINVDLNLSLFGTADYGSIFWDSDHTFDLITYNSLAGNFDTVSLTGLGGNPAEGSWAFENDVLNKRFNAVWTAVPEPSAALLGGLGLLCLLRRRRD